MDMTYINWEQNHIDSDIGHIFIKKKKKKHAMNNTNILINRKRKINIRTKLHSYLHERTLQWKNTLEIKEIFTSLRCKIFYL